MAHIKSVGLYTPAALRYLIDEGYLPAEPSTGQYQSITEDSADPGHEEEVTWTPRCVVYAKDGYIERVYRHDQKVDAVRCAILTDFEDSPSEPRTSPTDLSNAGHAEGLNGKPPNFDVKSFGEGRRESRNSSVAPASTGALGTERGRTTRLGGSKSRALAIVTEEQCHIHFLPGTSHVLRLPFPVANVLPMHHGLLFQRAKEHEPGADGQPKAPPNSFASSQPVPSLQQVTASKSLGGLIDIPMREPEGPDLRIETQPLALAEQNEDLPHFWILSDPLAECEPIAVATATPIPRHMRKNDDGLMVEYNDLDASEVPLYISAVDEMATQPSAGSIALITFVTFNTEQDQVTVWQGWRLQPRPLSSLMLDRRNLMEQRSNFRSSQNLPFTSGQATPSVRYHDKGRESFAATAQLPRKSVSRRKKVASPKAVHQDDEEAMTSRMDPYFAAQRPRRSMRRIETLLSRPEVNPGDTSRRSGSAFGQSQALSAKRGPSFGRSHDRRSFGTSLYRKSRSSMAGSTFSQDMDLDEDTSMDLDESLFSITEVDAEASRTAALFLATQEFAQLDPAFAPGAETPAPGFVFRKIHTLSLYRQGGVPDEALSRQRFKTHTRLTTAPGEDKVRLCIYVLDRHSRRLLRVHCDVAQISLQDHDAGPGPLKAEMVLPALTFHHEERTESVSDSILIKEALSPFSITMLESQHITATLVDGRTCSLQLPRSLSSHDPADLRPTFDTHKREFGVRRAFEIPSMTWRLQDRPLNGRFRLLNNEGRIFDVRCVLEPHNKLVARLLNLLQSVLSGQPKALLKQLWMHAVKHVRASNRQITSDRVETQATMLVLLLFAVGSIGRTAAGKSARLSMQTVVSEDAVSVTADSLGYPWQYLSEIVEQNQNAPIRKITSDSDFDNHVSMRDLEASARSLILQMKAEGDSWLVDHSSSSVRLVASLQIMLATQLYREDLKLSIYEDRNARHLNQLLAICLSQLGHYLKLSMWDYEYPNDLLPDISSITHDFSDSIIPDSQGLARFQSAAPFTIAHFLENALTRSQIQSHLTLQAIAELESTARSNSVEDHATARFLPRLDGVLKCVTRLTATRDTKQAVEIMNKFGFSEAFLASLPEAVGAFFREYLARCQAEPPSTWPPQLLKLVDRSDLLQRPVEAHTPRTTPQQGQTQLSMDLCTTLTSVERMTMITKSHEADRHSVIAQIFSEDKRFVDAARITNSSLLQVAECPQKPGCSDEEHLEQQKKLMQSVMCRTIALPPGNALVHFESQKPLASEKFQVPGFSILCQMRPMNNTISADKSSFTEEKFNWAFFHAGASAGLHISKKATGIDTSWIVYNRSDDSSNRHAGFLMALGLNGHLRNMAKWLAFKYLTPKHTMTSIGLLLGLSTSYMGTMDSLITRMLSVHITRMLPPGAAELNVSPLTQSVGLLGVGLLYCNTQHRRMSEIMLSELEYHPVEESGSSTDHLRDESYRLAAGFSLGLLNLGKGNSLQGLQGLGVLERLLLVAVGPRPVQLVHVLDKSTAGAAMAIALIYMKTNDVSIARKISVPDTTSQLDQIRPDILLLRTLAQDLIMWSSIESTGSWIHSVLPTYASHFFSPGSSALLKELPLHSADMPLYNIIAGHAFAMSLRFAGTASLAVRDEILSYLDAFWATSLLPAEYYDAQLARTTVRRCVDLLALAAATVMAGTGDIKTFRYLRRLHGRTDADTSYGSHMAAHIAVGVLFLGGGTYTFSTSNIAVAGLIIAFYPLWPSDVLDNAVHLQAFRHLWVLATDARCIVCVDVDSGRPVQVGIRIKLRDGVVKTVRSPVLLPELETVAAVETTEAGWWPAKLDFEHNEGHLERFRADQTLWVRRAPAAVTHPNVFDRSLHSLNERQSMPDWFKLWASLLRLPALRCIEESDLTLAIPASASSGVHEEGNSTVLDDKLALLRDSHSWDVQKLQNVKLLLMWAESRRNDGTELTWLGDEFVQRLNRVIRARVAQVQELSVEPQSSLS